MQYLISALGIIISSLFNLPSSKNNLSQIKKQYIGKTLSKLIYLFDDIIHNGLIILDCFEKGITYKEEIIDLITRQISFLNRIGNTIQNSFLWGGGLDDIKSFDISKDFYYKRTKIDKTLEIYGPKLVPSLSIVIASKSEILLRITHLLWRQFSKQPMDSFLIYELEYIAPEFTKEDFLNDFDRAHSISDLMKKIYEKEDNEFIRYKIIDLLDSKQRDEYITIAKRRLKIIKGERNKLANFLKENFEINEII